VSTETRTTNKKPNFYNVWPVSRKLEMKAQTCPSGAFKLSPESWNLKHFMDSHPTTAGGDGEQREPLHPCPVGLQGR